MRRGSVGKMGDDQAVWRPVVLVDDDDVGEAVFDRLPDDLLEGGVLAPHGFRLGDHSAQLFDECDRFLKISQVKIIFMNREVLNVFSWSYPRFELRS